MRRKVLVITLLFLLLSLTACVNDDVSLVFPESIDNATNYESPSVYEVEARLQMVEGINGIQSATAENDPYGHLNASDGYVVDSFFSYDQVNEDGLAGRDLLECGNDAGGSIEVYPTKEMAESRSAYLNDNKSKAGPSVVVGKVVIRISRKLDGSQQQDLLDKILKAFSTDAVDNAVISVVDMKEGYNRLQSLFLQINENYTNKDLSRLVEMEGLVLKTRNSWREELFISEEDPTGRTNGFESRPTYDSYFIRVSYSGYDDDLYSVDYYRKDSVLASKGKDSDWDLSEDELKAIK